MGISEGKKKNVVDFFWYDINACNNVRYILCNTGVITSAVKLVVRSPVCKLG